METAWIQIFILTFSECVAPAGKTVCQEQQFELRFLNRADCEYAFEQLLASKEELDYVIVNRQKSGCAPSAVQAETFASLEAIKMANKDVVDWQVPGSDVSKLADANKKYMQRLKNLMACDETNYVVPCKVGEIIVEEVSGDPVEVWKSDEH
jgi:hypothetical protein